MSVDIRGTRVEISFWFFAALTISSLFDSSGTLLAGLIAAAAHEAGHILCIILIGAKIHSLKIRPLGCELNYGECSRTQEAIIDLAGAGANLVFFGVSLFACLFLPEPPYPLIAANLFLGATNLLPALPLDGGQALRLLLSGKNPERCDFFMGIISFVIAVPVLAFGILVLIQSRYNFSLLSLGLWLFACALKSLFF